MANSRGYERAGDGTPMPADIESVLPFDALLDAAGAKDEEELAEAIASDAAALMDLGVPVTLQRYAQAVDLEAHPRAGEAAIAAYATSLRRFENLAPALAESVAREEAGATTSVRRQAQAEAHMTARRAPRRRAGKQLGVWTPVQLVLMFVFGAGMAVATLYWMGIVSTTRELHVREMMNRMEEERLRQEAEDQAVRIEQEWDKVTESAIWIIGMVKDEMEAGHLRDAAEPLLAFEKIYHEVARRKPFLLDEYAETRLDEIVMPALRQIYNVNELDGQDVMESVREQLAQLERHRAEQVLGDEQTESKNND